MAKLALTDISAGYVLVATYNANNALIEAALENTLSRDGTTPNTMSADLDMNSQQITNLPTPTSNPHAANKAYVDDQVAAAVLASGGGGSSEVNESLPYDFTNTVSFQTLVVTDGVSDLATHTVLADDYHIDLTNIVDMFLQGASNSYTIGTGVVIGNAAGSITADGLITSETGFKISDGASATMSFTDGTGKVDVSITGGMNLIDWGSVPAYHAEIYSKERASARVDVASYGQFWTLTATPNVPMFTDDTGVDQVIDPSVSTINEQNGSYTLLISDKGKTIHKASGGAGETYTVPANASVAYATGTLIAFQNDGGGDLTIAITTDTLTGTDGATGSRTLGDNHTAVIQKMTATTWKYAASDL